MYIPQSVDFFFNHAELSPYFLMNLKYVLLKFIFRTVSLKNLIKPFR